VDVLTTTDEISGKIQSIIQEVTDELFLISPYIQLDKSENEQWDKVKKSINFALNKENVKITFITRELDRIKPNNIIKVLEEFLGDNCKVILVKNLHSKVYFNGKDALVTSLNLYMQSAYNNYEIGVTFNQNDEEELKKIENYIQFLITEGKLFNSKEEVNKTLEQKGESELKREDLESFEFKVVGKGNKWYRVVTVEGYENKIAIDSVQGLTVGEIYKAKGRKEFINRKSGFYVVFRDIHDISKLQM